jgi:hypothetical protein
MYLIYSLIIVAMLFFFALPITDARTVRMKLSVVSSLGVLLAVSVVVPRLLH